MINNIFKTSTKYLACPIIFIASFLLVVNLLNLFPIFNIDADASAIFGACSIFFVCHYTANSKKGMAGATAFLLGDLILFSMTEKHFSLVLGIICAYLFAKLVKSIDLLYSFFLLLLISVSLGLLLGFLYNPMLEALKSFCKFVANKGALFGAANVFYSVFIGDNLESFIYSKDYSISTFINGEIITGIKDAFRAKADNPIQLVSQFLTGKYYLNIFVTAGVFVSLYKSSERLSLSLSSALALVFGDVRLLSVYLLIFNPMVFVGYLGLSFLSYLLASLLDIRIGFIDNGSIFELFKYGNNWGYLILSGLILAVTSYFLTQLIKEKFDIQKQKYIPKEARKIISALGGVDNIEKITDNRVLITNQSLVDVLYLNCEIEDNEVIIDNEDANLLNKYL